ncbi:CpxP family protein [Photobacterium profundum]|uniref:CpxP family protein n=1 Tax=Photobacterium profundum TaxID=74109 RepID=UPI003D0D59FB
MTSFKKALVIAIALPMALGSASALASGGGKHHGGKGACSMQDGRKVFSQLDLTEAQKEQMKSMREVNRDEMKSKRLEKHTEMKVNHDKMQALVLASDFDENAVRDLAQQMSAAQVEGRVAMLEKRHEMLNILTPEQKTKYQTLQAERAEKCQTRMAEHQK